jgi:acylphosphatase
MAVETPPSESRRAVRVRIEGRVQGVGFRWFARKEAERLGIRGYARNLPGGDVEVWAEGDPSSLEQFLRLVRSGPPHAIVRRMDVEEVEAAGRFLRFEIRP